MNENKLPDFDDMDKMARVVADSKAKLEDAKNGLESYVADCIREAMTDQAYWIDGKRPTMGYAEKVIALHGNTDEDRIELYELRQEIIKQTQRYQEAKALLDNMRDRIDVWQTVSANQRKVNF